MAKGECPFKVHHTEAEKVDGFTTITKYDYKDCCGSACPVWVHDSGGGHCGLAVR